MSGKLVTIAGNIGSGKSSLAEALAERLGAHLALERFSDNPFLDRVYQDPRRWGTHSQLWFLLSFAQTGQDLHNYPGTVIQDRSLSEAFEVFVRLYHEQGYIDGDEFHLLEIIHNQLITKTRRPDILVFLDTPTNLCLERIISRGRDAEQDIDLGFLERVEKQLHLFIESWPQQVIRIDGTPDLRKQENFEIALEQIDALL